MNKPDVSTTSPEISAYIKVLEEQVKTQGQKIDYLTQLLVNAQRARYGKSSEKKTYVFSEENEQLNLFNEAEQEQRKSAPEPKPEELTTVSTHKRKKKMTLEEKLKSLKTEVNTIELKGEQLHCSVCQGELKVIGTEYVRTEIDIIPQQILVQKYYRNVYACPQCEQETGYAHIVKPQAPPPVLEHSYASASSIADVMSKKYVEGMPLYRQEQAWKRTGVKLSRNTLANWVIQAAQIWLSAVYEHMKTSLLRQSVIHADETVLQVLKKDGKPVTSDSRMWVYSSGKESNHPLRIFEYQPGRSGDYAKAFLTGFHGCLVTDGYSGYNKVEGVTHCGCWAHTRRKWREAMPADKEAAKQSKAAIGFEYCNELFKLEKQLEEQGLKGEELTKKRQEKVKPILDAYWQWLDTINPQPGSKLAEAVKYSYNQRARLEAFLNHPEAEISNNICENAIRPFVIGRKGWLFSDTSAGAKASAIVYTLVESAKANNLNPYDYLLYLLSVLPGWGNKPSSEDLDRLLPWHPVMQKFAGIEE